MSGQPSVMFLLGSTLIALGLLVTLTTSQPTVTVTQGTLVGTTETFLDGGFSGAGNKKVNVFKGIPFAEPPLGSLRFKPPVEKASWGDEVYDATYFRPGCLQDPFYAQTLDFDIDEDCLHLNVFAPNVTLSEPVPVMVWIHGGGFTFGSAIERVYNGVPLAAVGDVIVVTVNYRLGVMGFLSTDVYDETVLDAVRMKYIDWSQAEYVDADYFRTMVNLVGDWLFSCTVDKLAHEHAKENEVFLYQLAHRPTVSYYSFQGVNPGWLGAAHAEDLPFVFGAAFVPESPSSNLTDEEKTFTVKVMKLWTNFAKSGNPGLESPGSQPISDEYAWPLYSSPDLKYKVLDLNLTTSRALKSDECYFWNTYVVQLRSALGELDDVERQWRQAFKTWKYTDMADWRDEFNKYKAVVYN